MKQNDLVKVDTYGVKINGEYKVLLCSSLFYFRIPRSEWENRIKSLLLSGYNAADVYFPWNFHETESGGFDFCGEKDVVEFLRLCAQYGLYVIARFGPYICSEWTGGALPARVVYQSGKIRTTDPYFIAETKKWYAAILPLIAQFQPEYGGTVILAQLENELDFFDCDDVDGYIGALKETARLYGVTVPVFCCAGQGNVVTSGGKVDGVLPTYNFYPHIKSADFDANCHAYAEILREETYPLLVTETGRETSIHKREFAAGAKLIGAYNQVAGSNFGYYQAVNNWGNVTSIIVTEYDFDSMIDVLGGFTQEVREARLFTRMLSALGERAAKALPSKENVSIEAAFRLPDKVNVLELYGGGKLVCLSNLSDEEGEALLFEDLKAVVGKDETVLLPFGVKTQEAEILFSNFEIYSLSPLTLYGRGKACVRIRVNGKDYEIEKSGTYGGVNVYIYSKEEMFAYDQRAGRYTVRTPRERVAVETAYMGTVAFPEEYKKVQETCFEANGIWEGGVLYKTYSENKRLLLVNPSDFLSVYTGGRYENTSFERGKTRTLEVQDERVLLRSEKWGACNFDESRESNLRIQSTRGIAGIYDLEKEIVLKGWKLTLLYRKEKESLFATTDKFDPIVDPNGYNSTRMPFEGVLYLPLRSFAGKKLFFSLENGKAEAEVYVSGEYAGRICGDRNMLDLSRFAGRNGTLQLLVRKRDWSERVGEGKLFVVKETAVEMCPFGKEFMKTFQIEDAKAIRFPINLRAGETAGIMVDMKRLHGKNCLGVATGKNYKLTAICDGEVVARMVAPTWEGVAQTGGSTEHFLLPASWRKDGKLKLLVESIGEETQLDFHFEI